MPEIIAVHAPDEFFSQQVLNLRGTPDIDAASAALNVFMMGGSSVGTPTAVRIFDLTGANVPPSSTEQLLGAKSFSMLYDPGTDVFLAARSSPDNQDDQLDGLGLAGTVSRMQVFNDAGWDRVRSPSAAVLGARSSFGAVMTSRPGDWSIEHRPAVSTLATVTRAAGAAGVRHVCTSIFATLAPVAAQGPIYVLLRDGAAGVGPVLWSAVMMSTVGFTADAILSGLNIVGSAATAMTLEFSAAPVATNFQAVSMTGYDAS